VVLIDVAEQNASGAPNRNIDILNEIPEGLALSNAFSPLTLYPATVRIIKKLLASFPVLTSL
jgi:hypothetical protein